MYLLLLYEFTGMIYCHATSLH